MPLTDPAAIKALLEETRTIAMIGASDRPDRASYRVMAMLQGTLLLLHLLFVASFGVVSAQVNNITAPKFFVIGSLTVTPSSSVAQIAWKMNSETNQYYLSFGVLQSGARVGLFELAKNGSSDNSIVASSQVTMTSLQLTSVVTSADNKTKFFTFVWTGPKTRFQALIYNVSVDVGKDTGSSKSFQAATIDLQIIGYNWKSNDTSARLALAFAASSNQPSDTDKLSIHHSKSVRIDDGDAYVTTDSDSYSKGVSAQPLIPSQLDPPLDQSITSLYVVFDRFDSSSSTQVHYQIAVGLGDGPGSSAGVVIGVLILIIVIIAIAGAGFWWYRRRRALYNAI